MELDFRKFNEFIESYAKPRWENQDEEWPLRPGGGEAYIHERVIEKAAPYFAQDKVKGDVKNSLLFGLKVHVNLLSRFEFSHAKKFIELTPDEELRKQIINLFYGEAPLIDRLRSFLEWAKVESIEDGDKKKGINPTVCSYFLALSNPRIYPYCKPTAYGAAIDCLESKDAKKSDPIERIIHCQTLYKGVLDLLEVKYALQNGNLFDVHSLFYLYYTVKKGDHVLGKYWQIAPGEGARLWPDLLRNSIAAVGFSRIDIDLTGKNEHELMELFKQKFPEFNDQKRKVNFSQLWNFINLKPGDKIITNLGKRKLLAVGKVTGPYQFRPDRTEYKHTVSVNYYKENDNGVDIPESLKGKFGRTILELKASEFETLEALFRNGQKRSVKNYWWLNANPKIWNFYDHNIGQKQVYTSRNERGNKRQIYQHFQKVKPDDLLVCYIASPTKEIAGIAKVTKALHETEKEEGFEFEIIEQFKETLSWHEFKSDPVLKESQPSKNNQGSLFHLTENEFEIISSIIDEKNAIISPVEIEEYKKEIELRNIFVEDEKFGEILNLLEHKKNLVLQGPPGVGKTFLAKHLAFAILGKKDEDKVQTIQFHQSYSYEDFIQGYRPDEEGGFYLKPGIFFNFCKKALRNQNNKYFFIIDEINRGNLSKIMGELMILIESDKRGKIELPLTYSKGENETFTVPPNLYLIGTMNTADRSLAMVDYALRRRFCFVDLEPKYGSEKFNDYLGNMGVSPGLIRRINSNLSTLNKQIEEDVPTLGPGFRIGHSHFCTINSDTNPDDSWYQRIVKYEIAPLLHEYWYDSPDKADSRVKILND